MTTDAEAQAYRIQALTYDLWKTFGLTGSLLVPNGAKVGRIAAEDRAMYMAVEQRDRDAETRAMLRGGAARDALKVLAIGDSITVGANSADGTGYRGWLADLLDRDDIAVAFDTTAALSGKGLAEIAAAVPAALAAMPDADIALVMIGTNDASFTTGGVPGVSWQAAYGSLVDLLLTRPDLKIVCARTVLADENSNVPELAWGNGAYPIFHANQNRINGYVDAVVSARLAGGRVIGADMTAIPPSWLTDGGWHPGDAGYLRMAHIWLEAMAGWL